jgi:nucleoside-diphosphate-sugar epimerase
VTDGAGKGFIASHVCDQLLRAGYRVRGTVRSKNRGGWVEKYFTDNYGRGKFEVMEVPEMANEGAFDEAVKGAAGFCHVATPVVSKCEVPYTTTPD